MAKKLKASTLAIRYKSYKNDPYKTKVGFEICNQWRRMGRWTKTLSINDFIESRDYTNFVKFGEFIKSVKINNVESYLILMKEKRRNPNVWSNNWSYRMYLEYIDEAQQPLESIKSTVLELFDICEKVDIEVTDIMSNFLITEIMLLMRQRRLSPWIMLHSPKTKRKVMESHESLQKEFVEMFDMDVWAVKFARNPIAVRAAKNVVKELNL